MEAGRSRAAARRPSEERSQGRPDRDSIEPSDLDLPDSFAAEEQSFQAMKSRAVQRFEHDFLATVLRAHDGNITRAASAAKKNRRAFWQLLRKHGLLTRARRD